MYRKMLSQPDDVLNSSFAMRMRIAGLRVSMSKLLRARFGAPHPGIARHQTSNPKPVKSAALHGQTCWIRSILTIVDVLDDSKGQSNLFARVNILSCELRMPPFLAGGTRGRETFRS